MLVLSLDLLILEPLLFPVLPSSMVFTRDWDQTAPVPTSPQPPGSTNSQVPCGLALWGLGWAL